MERCSSDGKEAVSVRWRRQWLISRNLKEESFKTAQRYGSSTGA